MLVKARPDSDGNTLKPKSGKSLVFCPAVLVTVTTSALELLTPYCVRLLVTLNSGAAGRIVRVIALVTAPAALEETICTLVKIPALVGVPITRTFPDPLVVRLSPSGRLVEKLVMG